MRRLRGAVSATHAKVVLGSICGSSPLLTASSNFSNTLPRRIDSHSGASVVITNAAKAAEERDRMVKALLAEENQYRERTLVQDAGIAHTVPYTIKVVVQGTEGMAAAKQITSEIITSTFKQADEILNHFNPTSEVSQINNNDTVTVHKMSPALSAVMKAAQLVYTVTGYRYDPACLPMLEFYKANPNELTHTKLSKEAQEIAAISSLSSAFEIDYEKGTIRKRDTRSQLDLSGIAKGWAVDQIIEALVARGFTDCFFDWGGDCRANGLNATGQVWKVAVIRPPSIEDLKEKVPKIEWQQCSSRYIRIVPLDNCALATSGDYENLVRVTDITDGDCHNCRFFSTIYDWQSKRLIEPSLDDVCQTTVVCHSAMFADALATACLAKREFSRIRTTLDELRNVKYSVLDYIAYARNGERVAHMHEIACESVEMKEQRIAGSLPARVVVVGGGLAGLSAAIEATNCGSQVVLIEKASNTGGNSAKATSGINGWGTRPQALQNVSDAGKYFERDTHLSGVGGTCVPGLVKVLSVKSSEAIKWLTSFGIPLTVLSQLGGHSRKRCHRAPDRADGSPVPIGYTIMKTLKDFIVTHRKKQVHLMTGTTVKELTHVSETLPDGTTRTVVTGVVYQTAEGEVRHLTADAVILTTGGFSNDTTETSLMKEYAPHLFGRPTTNGQFATGDGVKMARSVGAQLIDMDKIQLHPTGFIDPKNPANNTKYLGPEALRGSGGILLNQHGERFVNELDLRSVVSKAINAQANLYPESNGSYFAYCVLNAEAAKLFGPSALEYYWKKQGLFSKVDTVEELAALIGCPVDKVSQTLAEYEAAAKFGSCPKTGKKVFPCAMGKQGPFYVSFITPSIHYTMGGCLISPSAEIQSTHFTTSIFEHRRPILGLFGAGEVTGGVHGQNRLGGNSLLECVVFGRIAGDRAGTILQQKPTALSTQNWATVVLREVREGEEFGIGSKVLMFNLPGATQTSGLKLGQFVGIRGEWDGQQLVGYYSPITLPDEPGVIGILVRSDKGTLKEWLNALRPGDAIEMKGCGGLAIDRNPQTGDITFEGRTIRRFSLIAGGSGVAPMLQIMQAALEKPYGDKVGEVKLLYASEDLTDLTYRNTLDDYTKKYKNQLSCFYVLNNPPSGWTSGVGYIERETLATHVPVASDDLLVLICGPPGMQRFVKSTLEKNGYKGLVHTVDENATM